jgi:hypothetical protein
LMVSSKRIAHKFMVFVLPHWLRLLRMKYGGTEAATNEMRQMHTKSESNLRAEPIFAQARCSGLPPVIGVLKHDA